MTGINWNESEVEVESLQPFERNPRKISDAQYGQLLASLKENGYHQRILATQDLRVIGGHQRIKALKELGLAKVKVLTPDILLTDQQFRRILVQDNLPFGEFDKDILLTDYSKAELCQWGMPQDWLPLVRAEVPLQADDIPAIEEKAVSARGDIWILGNHRVLCGDSTDAADVSDVLAGARPNLMVTDPPYGVEYDANWRNEPEKLNLRSSNVMKSKTAAIGKVMNDHISDWSKTWAHFPGDVAYIWHGERQSPELVEHMRKAGAFEPRNLIVWAKSSLVISRGHYHPQHETCWYFVRKGKTASWTGDRKQSTLWQIAKPKKSETGHSTQKPVECMKRPIENNSKLGDGVYEPFSGSGTTIIAAQITGRKCFAIELNPLYVDMAVRRWEKYTGLQAKLERTGQTFTERAECLLQKNAKKPAKRNASAKKKPTRKGKPSPAQTRPGQ